MYGLFLSLADAQIEAFLRWLGRRLPAYTPPRPPRRFTFTVTQEVTPMGIAFQVKTHFPAPAVPEDVAVRELATSVNGADRPVVSVDLVTEDYDYGLFQPGDVLVATLTDIDANGNRSDPDVETLTVKDTVSPPKPGTFGFSVEQVVTPDPTPAP